MSATRSWTIGHDPACDLVVSQDFVSGRHCRLTQNATGFVLEDLGSTNGVFVNGERLTAPRTVTPRDRITLGQTTPMPWPAGAAAAPSPASPASASGKVITIGRGPENDVVLEYPTVSTRHARILVEGASLIIEDLGSTNGTFLGGLDRRITRAPLSPTDTVFFGTQPIPASQLLGSVAPTSVATMAITPQMLAAALNAPTARTAAAPVRPGAPTMPVRPPAIPTAKNPTNSWPVPPIVLACSGAAALVLMTAVAVWALRGKEQPGQVSERNIGVKNSKPEDEVEKLPGDAMDASDPRNSVYVVLVDSRGEKRQRVLGTIGTATAISDRKLVTSGGVVTEVQRALAESWDVSVYCPVTKKEFRVARASVHPEFESSLGEFNKAQGEFTSARETLEALQKPADSEESKEKPKADSKEPAPPLKPAEQKAPPSKEEIQKLIDRAMAAEDRMLKGNERMIQFDLGTLEVDGPLPAKVPLAESKPVEDGDKLNLLGMPKDPNDPETTRSEMKQLIEDVGRHRTRNVMIEGAGFSSQNTFVRAKLGEHALWNWAGCPVLNDDGRLVAIYSRPTPPLKANEKPDGKSSDIAFVARWSELKR